MTTDDRPAFNGAFKRLALTFRMKMRPAELENLSDTYFRLLESYSLHDVVAAGNALLHTHRRFPKPLDWSEAITRTQIGAPADVRVMSVPEATEYVRAERLHYDDDPCDCLLCQALPNAIRRRFVPDFTDDDREEKAFCPPKNRTVVVGHWAHGNELARWYAARDRFFGAPGLSVVHANVLRRFGFVYQPPAREPGQEG